MDGYLEKRSAGLLKVWQKRWFSRDQHQLQYFGKKDDTIPKGVLNLFDVTHVEIVAPTPEDDSRTRFNIVAKNKAFQLRAPTKAERDAWVEALVVWVSSAGREEAIPPPKRVARGILAAIDWLIVKEHSKQVKGIFRVPGAMPNINEIYQQICIHGDAFFAEEMMPENFDAYDVSSALKKLIRQLPESLLTNKLLQDFQKCTDAKTAKNLVGKLPAWNAVCLCKLIELCKDVCENTKKTMMTPGALSICLGPNLCTKEVMLFFNYTTLFTVLIDNKDYIFRDVDLEESLTDKGQSATEILEKFTDEVKYVESLSSRKEQTRKEIPKDFFGNTTEGSLSRQRSKKTVVERRSGEAFNKTAQFVQRLLSPDRRSSSAFPAPDNSSHILQATVHAADTSDLDFDAFDQSSDEKLPSVSTFHRTAPAKKIRQSFAKLPWKSALPSSAKSSRKGSLSGKEEKNLYEAEPRRNSIGKLKHEPQLLKYESTDIPTIHRELPFSAPTPVVSEHQRPSPALAFDPRLKSHESSSDIPTFHRIVDLPFTLTNPGSIMSTHIGENSSDQISYNWQKSTLLDHDQKSDIDLEEGDLASLFSDIEDIQQNSSLGENTEAAQNIENNQLLESSQLSIDGADLGEHQQQDGHTNEVSRITEGKTLGKLSAPVDHTLEPENSHEKNLVTNRNTENQVHESAQSSTDAKDGFDLKQKVQEEGDRFIIQMLEVTAGKPLDDLSLSANHTTGSEKSHEQNLECCKNFGNNQVIESGTLSADLKDEFAIKQQRQEEAEKRIIQMSEITAGKTVHESLKSVDHIPEPEKSQETSAETDRKIEYNQVFEHFQFSTKAQDELGVEQQIQAEEEYKKTIRLVDDIEKIVVDEFPASVDYTLDPENIANNQNLENSRSLEEAKMELDVKEQEEDKIKIQMPEITAGKTEDGFPASVDHTLESENVGAKRRGGNSMDLEELVAEDMEAPRSKRKSIKELSSENQAKSDVEISYLQTPEISPVRKSSLWHSDVMINFSEIIGYAQMEVMHILNSSGVDRTVIAEISKIHKEQLKRLDELFKSPRFQISNHSSI